MHQRSNAQAEVRQLRSSLAGVKREKRADGTPAPIKGLAAVYYREDDPGTEYWLWSDMVERIHPGAFDRAIKEQHDARALYNHDPAAILGRVSAGTCRLALTEQGLAYEIDADPNDPDHQRVGSKLDRGDVTGSSFAFITRKVVWEEVKTDEGQWLYIRNVHDLDLFDVGPVTWPAYEATAAGRSTRSDGQAPQAGDADPMRAELLRERDKQLRAADDADLEMRARLLELES
ncbi:HK97 family phage prohead protease [Aureliella helgolandensis]|uniref:Caudovirus prohead protease n=1 Tax=Aureliella helgolandensis TaxID=2527968 RepID=A0A518GDR4_9BACT|nr:HK97 family phage prohead protease [Aureliella helgolandensis]QDV26733.1 Caudovirus prohead protease [Aureliella helgolandensis]